jgi:hypothetical protein
MIGMDKISNYIGLNQSDVLMLIRDGRLENVTKNHEYVWVASYFKLLLWKLRNRELIRAINDSNAPNLQRKALKEQLKRLSLRNKGRHNWNHTRYK